MDPDQSDFLSSLEVFDIGNDTLASDIGINLHLNFTEGINQVFILISSPSNNDELTTSFLENLSENRRHVLFTSDTLSYSFYLPTNQLDLNGESIRYDIPYTILVYSPDLEILSESLEVIELNNSQFLNGNYGGNMTFFQAELGTIFVELTGSNDQYSGDVVFPNTGTVGFSQLYPDLTFGEMRFKLDGNLITEFEFEFVSSFPPDIHSLGCFDAPKILTGSGELQNFSQIVIQYEGDFCEVNDEFGASILTGTNDPGMIFLAKQ